MKRLIPLIIVLFSTACLAQQKTTVELVNPATVVTPKGYSQLAVLDLGASKMLILSGQVALDKDGNLNGKGDIAKQIEQTFANIKAIIESQGGAMANVVKLNYYLLDVANIQTLRAIRDKFIDVNHPPASTLVQVSKLFREDILVEIEATAVIPNKP
ncbi:RidA family protein [Mucilaginibacter gilvus]|uniref:RidA family protein n=1 Tax=Mucilaginibacter gilvus TaxID=2305909 RepID=A0A3S3VDG3_9SPHI|nr:RidA family protein [Mucilaginibacter gilvus]RWY51017.1 RidA family protein [Mucilaginibacter gilvus]